MTAPGFTEEWFGDHSQATLAKLVTIACKIPGLLVEIGAWEGRSTCAMANAAHPRNVHSCDTWQGSGHEISEKLAAERDVFAQWSANVQAYTKGNVIVHRMGWREYVPTITEQVALAFIDAEHSYKEVADNIRALLPLMAPGGIICGDDVHHGPVQQALADVLGHAPLFVETTLWIWQMPTDDHERDAVLLRGAHPELVQSDAQWEASVAAVMPLWREYVDNVSPLDHAASPWTLAVLHHLATLRPTARVLDLGSGISTAILARASSTRVTSVDTDHLWAWKTCNFLDDHGLPKVAIDSADQEPSGEFDLIFHDLASGEIRNQWADIAARHLAPGGFLVLDDAQNDSHRAVYREVAVRHGLELYSLGTRTVDAIGRWSMIAIRPDAATDNELAAEYARLCNTPSDIVLHLPRFAAMVDAMNAQHVIELGSRTGVSTVAWLYALAKTGGRLTSVDLDPAPPIGEHAHWTHIQGDDEDPDLFASLEPADIVFLDTSHHYEHTLRELHLYRSLVKPGGLIVCHDTELPMPEHAPRTDPVYPVKRAIERFVAETGDTWTNITECYGLGIIKVG